MAAAAAADGSSPHAAAEHTDEHDATADLPAATCLPQRRSPPASQLPTATTSLPGPSDAPDESAAAHHPSEATHGGRRQAHAVAYPTKPTRRHQPVANRCALTEPVNCPLSTAHSQSTTAGRQRDAFASTHDGRHASNGAKLVACDNVGSAAACRDELGSRQHGGDADAAAEHAVGLARSRLVEVCRQALTAACSVSVAGFIFIEGYVQSIKMVCLFVCCLCCNHVISIVN